MKVIKVEPEKPGYVAEIDGGLSSLQKEVGGDIEATYPYEEPVALICNEEGKINGMRMNRVLRDENGSIYDIVHGNFLIVGLGECDFCGLTPELINIFREKFRCPDLFFKKPSGRIVVMSFNHTV